MVASSAASVRFNKLSSDVGVYKGLIFVTATPCIVNPE
jgi:hypothetical protein